MLELPMAAARRDQVPAIVVQQTEDFAHFHVPSIVRQPVRGYR